ncbi:MAG: disulfide bond formation protein DsbA [Robiginitomaculum sp.]|nr:MAG: disulfide bond formation protein DsbA [Robiginitomaculum sp.]
MNFNFLTDSLLKTAALSLGAALILGACGGDKPAQLAQNAVEGRTIYETSTDHALGNAEATITLVEYASVTCPHCANWSATVFPDLRAKYIDTGKVRYVFREFPTHSLSNAGHLLANCAPEDKFFDVLHVQFMRMQEINTSSDIRGEFLKLAKSAGMNEAAFDACMVNETEIARLEAIRIGGENAGVTGTPTFFINGKKAPSGTFEIEDFDKIFAEMLGEPIPDAPAKSETTDH